MKKILLHSFYQKDKEFFVAIVDPRDIIRMVNIPESNTDQETNRPWKESRVNDISKYVAGCLNISAKKGEEKFAKGYMPNSPILALQNQNLILKDNKEVYLLLPEKDEEFDKCKESFNILDGQHRLISFDTKYIDTTLYKTSVYEMPCIICSKLTLDEKREIFMITNEKQEKVGTNVLKLMKKWLGLLTEEEDELYKIVEKLNKEDISLLKNRIIIGGNKVKNGFKAYQIIKILEQSGTYEMISKLHEDKIIRYICEYFDSWARVYNGMFLNSKCFLGKTTGLRYMFYIYPTICQILREKKLNYTDRNLDDLLNKLKELTIKDEKIYEALKMSVRSGSGTIKVALEHGKKLRREIVSEDFDIFG